MFSSSSEPTSEPTLSELPDSPQIDLQVSLSTISSNLSNLRTRNAELEDDLSDSRNRISELESILRSLRSEILNESEIDDSPVDPSCILSSVSEEFNNLRSKLESSVNDCDERGKRISSLESELESIHAHIRGDRLEESSPSSTLASSVLASFDTFRTRLSDLESANEHQTARIAELEGLLQTLRSSIVIETTDSESEKEESSPSFNVESVLASVKSTVSTLRTRNAELEDDLSDSRNRISDLESALRILESRTSEVKSDSPESSSIDA
jgi:chromosome segregation ATPase